MSVCVKKWIANICKVLVAVCGLIWVVNYADQHAANIPVEPERIEFQQLVQNSPGYYSIRWTDGPCNKVVEKGIVNTTGQLQRGEITKFVDVPKGQSAWALLERVRNKRNEVYYTGSAELHLTSLADIESGGQWRSGKSSHGEIIISNQ